MTTYVDRDAGFAAFVQGRSLCVRLGGRLNEAMARGVAERIRHDHHGVRLRLECSALESVEPQAAQVLANGLLRWSHSSSGRYVEVLNLGLDLQAQVGWHPLRKFQDPDEPLFIDPDRDDPWSRLPRGH